MNGKGADESGGMSYGLEIAQGRKLRKVTKILFPNI